MRSHPVSRFAAVALALLVAACASGPRELHYGQEECAHCRMIISDQRYAAQLVMAQGASRAFDDSACLAAYLRGDADLAASVRGVWLADHGTPGAWIPADDAWLVRSPSLRTPMGGGLAALSGEAPAQALLQDVGGDVVRWTALLDAPASAGGDRAEH